MEEFEVVNQGALTETATVKNKKRSKIPPHRHQINQQVTYSIIKNFIVYNTLIFFNGYNIA